MAEEQSGRKRSRIIVAKEKHESRYLDASTDEAWAKSALALLSERFKDGYWYYDPFADNSDYSVKARQARSQLLEMTEEAITALPASVAEDLRKKIESARRDLKEDEKAKAQYDEIKEVVEKQDLSWVGVGKRWAQPRAWSLLMARREYEYERVGLEEVEIHAGDFSDIGQQI